MSHLGSTYIKTKDKKNKRLDPLFKRSRRLGFSILENNKEFSKGKKRTYPPGQHGKRKDKVSEYKVQLNEKQKIAYLYGMNDKQLKRFIIQALKNKGSSVKNFLIMLESRLDSLVYKMGFAPTRRSARQTVSHKHVLVNGKVVNIPSYICKIGDVISIKESFKKNPMVNSIETNNSIPSYLKVDSINKVGTYLKYPERSESNPDINEAAVIEYYNRLL